MDFLRSSLYRIFAVITGLVFAPLALDAQQTISATSGHHPRGSPMLTRRRPLASTISMTTAPTPRATEAPQAEPITPSAGKPRWPKIST